MKPHRIAIVAPFPLEPAKITGGIEAVVQNLVNGLKNDPGLDLHILTFDYEKEVEPRANGEFHLHVLSGNKMRNRFSLFKPEREWIRRKIAEIQPDLIHVHGTDIYGFAAHNLEVPWLLTVHGILSREAKILEKQLHWRKRAFRWVKNQFNHYFENHTLEKARDIVVISPYVASQIKARTNARFHFIDNPIDERFFRVEGEITPGQFLCVGMIRARKGILNLVRAFKPICEKYPDIRLHLVGKVFEPEYFQLVQNYIHENQLERQILYLGRLPDQELFTQFSTCQSLILASSEESAPMVIAQAMAAGRPVIATRVGGVPFMVEDRHSGLLVEYGDLQAISAAVEFLYLHPERAKKMGMRGREIAEVRFRQEEVTRKTRELYCQLIAKQPGR